MEVYLVSTRRLDIGHQRVFETKSVCPSLGTAREKAHQLCSGLAGTFDEVSPGIWEYDIGGDHPVRVEKTVMDVADPDLGVAELCRTSAQIALDHGWKTDFITQTLLTVTELAEAVEEFRSHRKPDEIWYSFTKKSDDGKSSTTSQVDASFPGAKPEGIPVELADAVIRICDFCGQNGVDLAGAIRMKTEFNRSRPFKHGGKAC